MLNLRRFASTLVAACALLAPAAAHAQGFPGVPLPDPPPPVPAPVFPGVPLPYAPPPAYAPVSPQELPPDPAGPYAPGAFAPRDLGKKWYGWQILVPTLASDALLMGGAFSSGNGGSASVGMIITGLVGHGLSGPIVHLVHGHPLKALASFGLEAALPAAIFGAAMASPCSDEVCSTSLMIAVVGLPVAFTAGTAIDSAALGWEDRVTPAKATTGLGSITVAPLVLPPLRTGSTTSPRPMGASLVGTF